MNEDGHPQSDTPADHAEAVTASVTTTSRIEGAQSLHVLTVPYQLAQQGLSIAVALVVFGVPGVSSLFGSGRSLLAVGATLAVVLGIAAITGYFVARYRRFEYELTPDTFDIRSGVLSRRQREIPLRRIQNVDISQNVVQRLLSVAQVGLETAGGGGTEAQLRYVGVEQAERLQAEISRLSRVAKAGDGEPTVTDKERF